MMFRLGECLYRSWQVTPGGVSFGLYLFSLSIFLACYQVWEYAFAYALAGFGLSACIVVRTFYAKFESHIASSVFYLLNFFIAIFASWQFFRQGLAQLPICLGLLLFLWLVVFRQTSFHSRLLRLECFFMGVGMLICYTTSGVAFDLGGVPRYDAWLFGSEAWLLGTTLNQWSQQFVTVWLSDVLSFFYMFFQLWLDVQLLRYFVWDQHLLVRFYAGMFVTYGLGFLGYVLLPARGAFKAFADKFDTPIQGGWLTQINHELVSKFATGIDVFPSLHVGVSVYMLGFLWRHQRFQSYFFVLPTFAILCSTIYLRYHYAIDVVCGVLLAVFALWVEKNFRVLSNDKKDA